jgi:hypothetical protein
MQSSDLNLKQTKVFLVPKSNSTNDSRTYLKLICVLLALVVCVQFTIIAKIRYENVSDDGLVLEQDEHQNLLGCSSFHSIAKRQVGRGMQICPPGM